MTSFFKVFLVELLFNTQLIITLSAKLDENSQNCHSPQTFRKGMPPFIFAVFKFVVDIDLLV